jgi:hypothetical protein
MVDAAQRQTDVALAGSEEGTADTSGGGERQRSPVLSHTQVFRWGIIHPK